MKAVIFDMDGVLIHSEEIHTITKIKTLEKYGITATKEDCLKYVGRSANAFFGDFINKATSPVSIEEITQYKKDLYLDYMLNKNYLKPIEGAEKLLKDLKDANIKIALASSSRKAIIEALLGKLDFLKYFEFILSGADLPKSKPDPTIYQLACEKLGKNPKDCVVIEDAAAGIMAAYTAGCYTIAYKNPDSGNQDLSLANEIVHSLNEITPQKIISLP